MSTLQALLAPRAAVAFTSKTEAAAQRPGGISRLRPRRGCPYAVLALALAGLGCSSGSLGRADASAEEPASTQALDVEVVFPARGDIVRTISLPASIEADQRATLYSKVSGYLESIAVDIGDRVSQGQLLAEIDVPEISDQLREGEAELAAAAADRSMAEAELASAGAKSKLQALTYERLQAVRTAEPDVVSQQDVDEAEAQSDMAAANVREIESQILRIDSRIKQLEAAKQRLQTLLGFAEIRAPFNGIVTDRFVDPGALLQAATSSDSVQKIITVAKVDKMRIAIDVPESEAPYVQAGGAATVTIDAMPGKQFRGSVSRFSRSLNPATRTMRAEIDLPNADGLLLPGMFGRATLTLATRAGAVTVPAEALHAEGKRSFVYQVVGGRARRVDVETAPGDGIEIEITGGLDGSERVIVAAREPLSDGSAVNAVEVNPEPRP
ncbi:MAG: efflux RND transporter periplasmic adaptor subunit [Bryobacterales bacterium]|nr:efflux RND transporter periplasmic adaptor subunit [Bryobacterales bacterium]